MRKSTWLVRGASLLMGMAIGLTLVMRAPGDSDPHPGATGGPEGLAPSPLTELSDLHDRMVAEGLPLARVRVESVTYGDGEDVVFSLTVEQVVWIPSWAVAEASASVGQRLEARSEFLTQAAISSVERIGRPFAALAVIAKDGDLLALAPLADGSSFADVVEQGPLFLVGAGREIYAAGYDPLPRYSNCVPVRSRDYASEVDALTSYFASLGDLTLSARTEALASIDETVERLIQESGDLVDPVTGRHVTPARNDLARQLRSGVPPEDVIIRPAIPVAITLPQVWDFRLGDVLVFFDHPDNQILGWLPIGPVWEHGEDGSSVPNYETVIELAPPASGASLAVYVRRLNDARFDCAPTAGEEPYLLVPHDDFAGARRATLDVARQSYVVATDV